MSPAASIERRFSKLGGSFVASAAALGERLEGVRAWLFDWDGVFNTGEKGDSVASTFSEPDSMGTNLLRYAFWREHGELPVTGIVTGANNPSARQFATREHFSVLYSGVLDKGEALDDFCTRHGLEASQVAFVFDDVNDLAVAARCGARFLARRAASPLLADYAVRNGLCDYVTGAHAGYCAVREVAELAMGLSGAFDAVVASRVAFDEDYTRYFEARQAALTVLPPESPS